MNKKLLILVLLHLVHSRSITAASGQLDTSFGTVGSTLTPVSQSDFIGQSTVLASDKVVVIGTTQQTGPAILLAQYTSTGALDTASFNSGGSMPGTQTLLVGTESDGNALAIDGSGNILAAGLAVQTQTNMLLARYTSAGALDTTFNSPTGYVTLSIGTGASASAVAIQNIPTSGNIILAGTAIINELPNFAIARFTSAGVLDTANFNSPNGYVTTQVGVISYIQSMVIDSSGNIVVLGNVDDQITLARYTPNGTLDGTFGTGGIFQPNIGLYAIGYDLILDASGNILASGSAISATGVTQALLIRCLPTGTLDPSFNGSGFVTTSIAYGAEFYSLVLEAHDGSYNNDIVASGYAISAPSYQVCLARYTPSGSLDPAYGTNGVTLTTYGNFTYVQDVQLQSTGEAVVAGLANGAIFLQRYTG